MHNEKDIVIDPVIDDFQSYLSRQQMSARDGQNGC